VNRWMWIMAWRESRGNLKRLGLFVACIVTGVAALVSITSFGHNLDRALGEQAKTLLGADFVVDSRMAFSPDAVALLDSIGGEQTREVRFASMAYFPESEQSRLSQIRAIEGGFPYYGVLVTEPADAKTLLDTETAALVDEGLMMQFGAEVGDSVKIGQVTYRIAGRLVSIPGESAAQGIAGPRVFIPLRTLEATELVQRGSQVRHVRYVHRPDEPDIDAFTKPFEARFDSLKLDLDTVESRKRSLGRTFGNLTSFLNLVGFIALLLGGVGIASSIHVYIKGKVNTVAVLRCLGVQTKQALGIYAVQAAAMGFAGAAAGSLIGVMVQVFLPKVLNEFLPVDITFGVSLPAIGLGMLIGITITALFALQPLVAIRNVSPLLAIRQSFESDADIPADPLKWVLWGVVGAGILACSLLLADDWRFGVGYFSAILVVFALLSGLGWAVATAFKRWFPRDSGFAVRQGFANLYRPNNQTGVMIMTLGFGTFLIATLFLTRDVLINQIERTDSRNQPNLVFYDVQSDQADALREVIAGYGRTPRIDVPIVTMRMAAINNVTVEALRASGERRIPNWMYEREMRSTYRDTLTATETLVAGEWIPVAEDPFGLVPISVEKSVFDDLRLQLGDTIRFDIQGVPFDTRIASVRLVDWQQIAPNFIFLFPKGVLEPAPQFRVMILRTESREESVGLQQEVVRQFPNVSAVDLALVLSIAETLIDRVGFVIRFMALFSVFTGLIVLSGTVIASRYQRIQESVLLKTLGARRHQVLAILGVEYLVLGFLAAVTGLGLAYGAAWGISFFVFDTPFIPTPIHLVWLALGVMGLTLLFGLLNSGAIYRRSALEVLREG
jgi:putative ABC transport system permease protein